MKKISKAIILILCIGLVVIAAAGCSSKHKITITGDDSLITECPKRAAAGETVTVITVSVTDAELYLNVSGVDCERIRDGEFQFVMPDADVEVSAYVSTVGFPGA